MKRTEYVVIIRAGIGQFTGCTMKYLVRKEISHLFPKRNTRQSLTMMGHHMADIIFADGVLIKNVFGPINPHAVRTL